MSGQRKANGDENGLRVAVSGDHEGLRQKERLVLALREDRYSVKDLGVHGKGDTSDFVEATELVVRALRNGEAEFGIIVSGTGAGAGMAANKVAGIRAAYCTDTVTARQCRRQVAANVLCIGSRVVGDELAIEISHAWLATRFSEEQRHQRLIRRLAELEQQFDASSAVANAVENGGD